MSDRSDSADAIDEAYRAGRRVFMGVTLEVAPGALVPRAETELLGETAARILADTAPPPGTSTLTVIDMCCGSGNLACGLAAADARRLAAALQENDQRLRPEVLVDVYLQRW